MNEINNNKHNTETQMSNSVLKIIIFKACQQLLCSYFMEIIWHSEYLCYGFAGSK
jgi:hypothetical protein